MSWWYSVVSLEFRKIFAYRSDFWVTFLGQTFIQLVVARSLWQAIFESQGTEVMQGFTLPMMTLYYLMVPIGTRMLAGETNGFLSKEIYDGTFTRYLIYPLSFFNYKILTYLSYSVFYGLQLLIFYSLFQFFFIEGSVSLLNISNLLLGLGLFLISATIYFLMSLLIEMLALWADNIWSLTVMMRFFTNFFGGGLIPLAFFPAEALTILQWTPFPYLISLPVRTIMGMTSASEILSGLSILIFWGATLSFSAKLMWARGQKNYSGVGI